MLTEVPVHFGKLGSSTPVLLRLFPTGTVNRRLVQRRAAGYPGQLSPLSDLAPASRNQVCRGTKEYGWGEVL